MKTLSYLDVDIDVDRKDTYRICPTMYKSGNIEVLIRPFSGALVVFEDCHKVREKADIIRIFDGHPSIIEEVHEIRRNMALMNSLPKISDF